MLARDMENGLTRHLHRRTRMTQRRGRTHSRCIFAHTLWTLSIAGSDPEYGDGAYEPQIQGEYADLGDLFE